MSEISRNESLPIFSLRLLEILAQQADPVRRFVSTVPSRNQSTTIRYCSETILEVVTK